MLPGIYFNTGAGIVRQKELAVITQNLSNAMTPGYKKERIAFSRYYLTVIERIKTDFSQGDITHTGNPFDVAICENERAFFVVRTPEGIFYTRRGDFSLSREKKLITRNGFFVQGQKGDIVIKGSQITITEDGRIIADGKTVDKIKIVELPLDKVERYGRTLFRLKGNIRPKESESFKIMQGYLELSNVRPVEEVARMISCLRNYEISQKSIQSQDEMTSKLINEVGSVRI